MLFVGGLGDVGKKVNLNEMFSANSDPCFT